MHTTTTKNGIEIRIHPVNRRCDRPLPIAIRQKLAKQESQASRMSENQVFLIVCTAFVVGLVIGSVGALL